MCGVIASIPILAIFWFKNHLSDGVIFMAVWNIVLVIRLLITGVRRYDVALKGDTIHGLVKGNWLDPGDARDVDLRQIDFAHSGRFLITDWRLRLLDGRQVLLSNGWYPIRQIRNLYEELQRRANSLGRDAASSVGSISP